MRRRAHTDGSRQVHPIPPVWDARSRALVLGSFPSEASRAAGFYYANPRNRFWRVLAAVLSEPEPLSVPEKKLLLLQNRIALWDAAISCEIKGSSDAALRHAEPCRLEPILRGSEIRYVFTNGQKAHELYARLLLPLTGLPDVALPSTSPANASFGEQALEERWKAVAAAVKV